MVGWKEERRKEGRNLFLNPFHLQFNVGLQYPREHAHGPERLRPHVKISLALDGLSLER